MPTSALVSAWGPKMPAPSDPEPVTSCAPAVAGASRASRTASARITQRFHRCHTRGNFPALHCTAVRNRCGPIACAALLWAATGCRDRDSHGAREKKSAAHSGPRLLVLVIIDQLPSWSFDRSLPQLHGGLAKIARDSVRFTRVE